MNARISKRYSFDAAHQLPNHSGKCSRPHGHTYGVELVIAGTISTRAADSSEGMVLDYAHVDALWKLVEPLLDHQDLNKTLGTAGCWPTTAENIALWLLRFFHKDTRAFGMGGTLIEQVIVSETPKTSARVLAADLTDESPAADPRQAELDVAP